MRVLKRGSRGCKDDTHVRATVVGEEEDLDGAAEEGAEDVGESGKSGVFGREAFSTPDAGSGESTT